MRRVRFPGRVRTVSPRPKVEEAPKAEEPKVEKKKSSKK